MDGDSYNVYNNTNNYMSWNYSYTYFPYSGNIYQVRGYNHPAFIRNIQGHNYNPSNLFWGVLNSKFAYHIRGLFRGLFLLRGMLIILLLLPHEGR